MGLNDSGGVLRPIVLIALLAAAAPAAAKELVVHTDESWVFSISGGQPVRARRVKPDAKLEKGQVLVTVRSMMGTTMTITSNNRTPYLYRAELIGVAGGKTVAARACTLPADGKVAFEHWPQQAKAVRLSTFRRTRDAGNCP